MTAYRSAHIPLPTAQETYDRRLDEQEPPVMRRGCWLAYVRSTGAWLDDAFSATVVVTVHVRLGLAEWRHDVTLRDRELVSAEDPSDHFARRMREAMEAALDAAILGTARRVR